MLESCIKNLNASPKVVNPGLLRARMKTETWLQGDQNTNSASVNNNVHNRIDDVEISPLKHEEVKISIAAELLKIGCNELVGHIHQLFEKVCLEE